MPNTVRVRFAPSPTGPLHIGGVRAALFNYLFAKKNNGTFILRIEDTDQSRYAPNAEKYIIESLKWCGIEEDEGVMIGGTYGPYRQSERKHLYKQYADQLIKSGKAYFAFDTPEELEKAREQARKFNKDVWKYDASTRMSMNNSLVHSPEVTEKLITSGAPYVIRLMIDNDTEVCFNDIIRRNIKIQSSMIDDKVIFKSDGMPTYHLANVVDDHLMKITHVIRGEEWLPSTPLHILLYQYLGWGKELPCFAHLPLILNQSGKGKLSKRDSEKLGVPVFPISWNFSDGKSVKGFRELGFFPEPFVNMLALLGWNPGSEKEVFSMRELINEFSMDHVGKSGARFDYNKAVWFNEQYLRNMDEKAICDLAFPEVSKHFGNVDYGFLIKVISLIRDRISFVRDIWEKYYYFFIAPQVYNEKVLLKKWNPEMKEILKDLISKLSYCKKFETEHLEELFQTSIEQWNLGISILLIILRVMITGINTGPSLFNIMEIIGKEETLKRINLGLVKIKSLCLAQDGN